MTQHYPYLIIGGGMAADAAARGIRQVDPEREIGLIGQEPDPPYNRPPLSKGLWKTTPRPMPLSRIWRGTGKLGVDLMLGRTAARLDPQTRSVVDDLGSEYTYNKLLLATGGQPIQLEDGHDRVMYFRTLADYNRLRQYVEQHQRFAVIGGGFVGSEVAALLANLGKEVVMVFPEPGICARTLPADFSVYLNAYFQEKGVRILKGNLISTITPSAAGVILRTDQGAALEVDVAVAGLGIRPNTTLAASAGLAVNDGILVDRYLQTSHPDIYAAGDVANFHSSLLDTRLRPEHEEHANLSGLIAGLNMAGQPTPYDTLPAVYSTLFEINYDAVGELNPSLPAISKWLEPYRKGIMAYIKNGIVRGVLLVNLTGGLEKARALIAQPAASISDEWISQFNK